LQPQLQQSPQVPNNKTTTTVPLLYLWRFSSKGKKASWHRHGDLMGEGESSISISRPRLESTGGYLHVLTIFWGSGK